MQSVLARSVMAAALVLILDQGSKWLAGVKGLVVLNPGAAFSLGQGSSGYVLWGSLVALAVIFLAWPQTPRHDKVYLAFVLAAGASNLVDRLTYGGVRDFLDLPAPLASFPVFNVADLILTISVGWLLLHALFRPPHHPHP